MARLFSEGRLTIARGIGMPRPDRSHFVSLERWHSGRLEPGPRPEGWLAHAVREREAERPPPGLDAIALGDRELPLLLRGPDVGAAAAARLDELLPRPETLALLRHPAVRALDQLGGSETDRRQVRESHRLAEALRSVPTAVDLPPKAGALGRQLGDVLRLLRTDLGVRAFFVRFSGFDTHARQARTRDGLLRALDAGLVAFQERLERLCGRDRVLVVVYSEFGRRVAENGSLGTDHGSAGDVFLLGGAAPGGFLGRRPDLGDLDEGDVRSTLDFRRVLATAVHHLGGGAPEAALGPAGRPLF